MKRLLRIALLSYRRKPHSGERIAWPAVAAATAALHGEATNGELAC